MRPVRVRGGLSSSFRKPLGIGSPASCGRACDGWGKDQSLDRHGWRRRRPCTFLASASAPPASPASAAAGSSPLPPLSSLRSSDLPQDGATAAGVACLEDKYDGNNNAYDDDDDDWNDSVDDGGFRPWEGGHGKESAVPLNELLLRVDETLRGGDSPSMQQCSALLLGLCEHGRLDDARLFWQIAQQHGLVLQSAVYSALIASFTDREEALFSQGVFDVAAREGVTLSPLGLRKMVYACLHPSLPSKMQRRKLAVHLHQLCKRSGGWEALPSRVHCLVVEALGRLGQPQQALSLAEELKEVGAKGVKMSALIACISGKLFNMVPPLLDELQGEAPAAIAVATGGMSLHRRALLEIWRRSPRNPPISLARQIYSHCQKGWPPGCAELDTTDEFLRLLSAAGQYKEVLSVDEGVVAARAAGPQPPYSMPGLRALVSAHHKLGHSQGTLTLLDAVIRDGRTELTTSGYGCLMHALVRSDRPLHPTALLLIELMWQTEHGHPDTLIYNMALGVCAKQGDRATAEVLLADMVQHNVPSDKITRKALNRLNLEHDDCSLL